MVELLVSLLISALILAPLPNMVSNALAVGSISQSNYDLHTRARFAINRITQKITTTPHSDIAANASSTSSGSWFTPVTYSLSGTQLIEADATGNRVLADEVTAFSISLHNRTVGREKITVSLTLAKGRESITRTETVQLGAAL